MAVEHKDITTQTIGKIEVISAKTPAGAEVIFLEDGGAMITPEDEAMLQALYSRSNESVTQHVQKVLKAGSGKFMETYYIGYGHKSIGDCGSATVYIENVSMLAAKALQHNQLYNGQERSTRYINFGTVPFINPLCTELYPHSDTVWKLWADEILEGWRHLYQKLYPKVQNHLFDTHPYDTKTLKKVYENAIKAKAFDICRGLLPAGASTGLAWHGELSVFGECLPKLKVHPLAEVRQIAQALECVLTHVFKHSFPVKNQEALEEYYRTLANEVYHHDISCPLFKATDRIVKSAFPSPIKKKRNFPLPDRYKENGSIEVVFQLDYGSYRDIARHRSVLQPLPLLTTDLGMHPWHLRMLDEIGAAKEIRQMAKKTEQFVDKGLKKEVFEKQFAQYVIPMAYRVSCRITGNLHALGYITELRSSSKVHPTLAELMYHKVRESIAPYVVVKCRNPFRSGFARGKDTITERTK